MIEKNPHTKSSINFSNFKQGVRLNEKSNQFFSEPTSLEGTPKSVRSSRLEPLNQALLAKKLASPISPFKKHTKTQSDVLLPKAMFSPPKTWTTNLERTNTPKGTPS